MAVDSVVHEVERDGREGTLRTTRPESETSNRGFVDGMVIVRGEEAQGDLAGFYMPAGKLGLFVLCPNRNFQDG